jgi:hypothetical protein
MKIKTWTGITTRANLQPLSLVSQHEELTIEALAVPDTGPALLLWGCLPRFGAMNSVSEKRL